MRHTARMIKNFFSTIKRALKGEHHDYTQGDITQAVVLLAVPMILELGLESVFAVVELINVTAPISRFG